MAYAETLEQKLEMLNPNLAGEIAGKFWKTLSGLVVGQRNAVDTLADFYDVYLANLADTKRPIGTALFLGPTGSGKTRSVEAAAETLFGSSDAMVKINCGEFQHSHEISKLIGSPPGYVGHGNTNPLLTQHALSKHHTPDLKLTLVLFDEIEKASEALWQLLLGILDKGVVRTGENVEVKFSKCIIVMTSNVGARQMRNLTSAPIGFQQSGHTARENLATKLQNAAIAAAERRFPPEFTSRFDRIVVFQPLDQDAIEQILELELTRFKQRLRNELGEKSFKLEVAPRAKQFLRTQGFSPSYGGRELNRVIQTCLVQPLARCLNSGQIQPGETVVVDYCPIEQATTFGVIV